MAKKNEIYKCEKSGLMVEVLQDAEGTPMCCDEPMKLLRENTTDGAKEKHVPVVEKSKVAIVSRWALWSTL